MKKELAVEKVVPVCDQMLLNLDIGDAIILQKQEEDLPKLAPSSDNSTSTAGTCDSDTYTSLSKVTTATATTNNISSSENNNTNLPKVVGFNSIYTTNNTDTILFRYNIII
ncbi:MAG: hypothetical protein ACI8RD_005055 [Bacillariaceae sp.]|jgi:hypothetical protein